MNRDMSIGGNNNFFITQIDSKFWNMNINAKLTQLNEPYKILDNILLTCKSKIIALVVSLL